ncbi:MAG: EamA family transporter [Candidatus Riflebacteria bacterium]|nr:EamA family transporter [Candidatus Riflebacteria bacterium]
MQPSHTNHPDKFVVAFYLVFTVIAFSSIEIMVNPVRNDIAPLLMNFWRFLIATLILLPTLLWTSRDKIRRLRREDMRDLIILGSMNIILTMGAHAMCIKYARASTAAILISANPLATNFFAWLLLKEEMTFKRIFALLLGFAGIVLLTYKADAAMDTPYGMVAGVIAMAGFGLFTVLSKRLVQKHGGLMVMVLSCLPALVLYLPVLYFADAGFWPPAHTWPNVLGVGIIGTGLGYLTFLKSLEFLSAGRCSYLFFFKPPVAMFFAWLLLGEQISLSAFLGTMLIMTGILTEIKRAGQKAQSV